MRSTRLRRIRPDWQPIGYYGQVVLWGPGIPYRQSPIMRNPSVSAYGAGTGLLCARGNALPVPVTDVDFPCVWVP